MKILPFFNKISDQYSLFFLNRYLKSSPIEFPIAQEDLKPGRIIFRKTERPHLPNSEQEEDQALQLLKSNEPKKAAYYLIKAGDEARRCSANESAIRHYRQALDLLPKRLNGDNKKFFEARLGLGNALKLRGEFVEAQTVLLDILQILEKWENRASHAFFTPILVETLRELADVRQREGSFAEAMNYLELGLHHLSKSRHEKQRQLWCRLMDRIAWIRFRQGDFRNALETANAAIESSIIDKSV